MYGFFVFFLFLCKTFFVLFIIERKHEKKVIFIAVKLLKNNADYDYLKKLSSHGLVFLLKHSTTCPISAGVKNVFDEFSNNHSDIPCFMLEVQNSKTLSNVIAEQTGVEHESPQVLVFKNAIVLFHEEHQKITNEALESFLSSNSSEKTEENQT